MLNAHSKKTVQAYGTNPGPLRYSGDLKCTPMDWDSTTLSM